MASTITITPTLDTTSSKVNPGDSTVTAGNPGNTTVARAAAATIAASPGPQGIVVKGAVPGGTPTVAVAGIVPNSQTGLGVGVAQRVLVDPVTGRPARVLLPRGSEAFLGNVDRKGNLTVAPLQHVGTTPRYVINVCAEPYNAIPDFQYYDSGSPVTPGLTNHLTGFPVNTFSASEIGKVFILINGCFGSSPADLHTTITGAGGKGGSNPNGTDVILAKSLTYGGVLNSLVVFWGADNTAAIQAAHDAAFALGHTVHIPYGQYLFMGQLRWKEGVNLSGDGRGALLSFEKGSQLVTGGNGRGTIQSCVDNGRGLIRVTALGHQFATGDIVVITGVNDATNANGQWEITVIDPNTFDLQGSKFAATFECQDVPCPLVDRPAILYAPSNLGSAAHPYMPMWRDLTLVTGTQDSSIGLRIVDSYNAQWYSVAVIGTLSNSSGEVLASGFQTAGIQFAGQGANSTNSAFLTFVGCIASNCVGDGLNFDNSGGTTVQLWWHGGSLGSTRWGAYSGPPAGAASPSIHLVGVDFEGGGNGGVTGFYDVVEINGCYLENNNGVLIDINGQDPYNAYAYSVIVRGNYISKWGARPSPIYLVSGSGIHDVNIEGNYSPWPASGLSAARCMATIGGATRVRIGANYSILPVVDFQSWDTTMDSGDELVTYRCVVEGVTAPNVTNDAVAFDASGKVTELMPSRKGRIVGVRAFLTQTPTNPKGHWRVWVGDHVSGGIAKVEDSTPIRITTSFLYPWSNNMQVKITGTGIAAIDNLYFIITAVDDTGFDLNGTTASGGASGGDLTIVKKDSHTVAYPNRTKESIVDSTGSVPAYNSHLLIEDALIPGRDGIQVAYQTDPSYSAPKDTALVIETTVAYERLTAGFSGPLIVTSISPSQGPAAGGTPVTINGSGFAGATVVNFGSNPATGLTVSKDTQMAVISPAGTGTVDVTVLKPGFATSTSPQPSATQFTYV
jgi:IPT/TIG domain/Pectate lyase superfamily protein